MTVSPLQGITHACFGLSYLLAFGLEVLRLFWPAAGWRVGALGFGLAGVFAHTAYLAFHHPTPAAPYGSLLLLAWVLALFYLYGNPALREQGVGRVRVARRDRPRRAVPRPGDDRRDRSPVDVPSWLSGERFWGVVHGTLLLLASVGVSVGFLASVMYLIQTRRVRNKVNPARVVPMLSLERLETMNRRAVNLAFPLLTAGLLVGTLLLRQEHDGAGNWLSVKVVSTAGLWVVFLVLLYLRYAAHLPGRRLAVFSIAAFGLLLVALGASHPFVAGGGR